MSKYESTEKASSEAAGILEICIFKEKPLHQLSGNGVPETLKTPSCENAK